MADAFHLQIISPAAIVVDAYVPMVEVPGTEGDFGVLPGHSPFFSMIRPGVVDVHLGDGNHRRFFAASGYADVSPTGCTILSDHIQDIAEISPSDAQEALVSAQEAAAQAASPVDKDKAQKMLVAAEALVLAIQAAGSLAA